MSINVNSNVISNTGFNSSGDILNNPSIVTDGLVLWLDAGNNASYINSSSYYDCGYGCQYYASDPGCTNCNTQIKDMSGYGNDGSLTSGASVGYSNIGGYVNFDGTNDYVNILHSSSIQPSTGYITTSAWFYSTETGSIHDRIILNKENEYEISAGGGYVSYAFRPNWAWVGSTAFNINQWYNVSLTYDQSYQRLYLNGSEVYYAALTGAIGTTSTADLRIGARGAPGAPTSPFKGYIPIVHVYNRALTATEVLQNFNNGRQRFGV